MRKGLSAALFFACLLFSAVSQAEELTAQKRADIERLLHISGAMTVGQQMGGAIVVEMTKVLRQARPDIPQHVLDMLVEEVNAVMAERLPGMATMMVPVYHRNFSAAEIKELLRFYGTEIGQKAVRVMPQLMNESLVVGQQWGKSVAPEVQRRVSDRLAREGYPLR